MIRVPSKSDDRDDEAALDSKISGQANLTSSRRDKT